ncbi:hypothetical protein Trydic_g7788 [Trypoxylus dichotomus]
MLRVRYSLSQSAYRHGIFTCRDSTNGESIFLWCSDICCQRTERPHEQTAKESTEDAWCTRSGRSVSRINPHDSDLNPPHHRRALRSSPQNFRPWYANHAESAEMGRKQRRESVNQIHLYLGRQAHPSTPKAEKPDDKKNKEKMS